MKINEDLLMCTEDHHHRAVLRSAKKERIVFASSVFNLTHNNQRRVTHVRRAVIHFCVQYLPTSRVHLHIIV